MAIMIRPIALPLAAAFVLGAAIAAPAPARSEPVYKDRERFDASDRASRYRASPRGPAVDAHPRRRVTFGPGYAGSEWGLGKPSFWGIGPRPDDGW